MLCEQNSNWIQTVIEGILFPFLVAAFGYIVITKLDDWKKRRSHSGLGAVIIESLIEEVRQGLSILTNANATTATSTNPLPRKSWNGMSTIPDDVLLRIIEVSKGVTPISFSPREIRTHCKNYFDHMTTNWDEVAGNRDNWKLLAQKYFEGNYIQATQNVLDMLQQTGDLLESNSRKWFPK